MFNLTEYISYLFVNDPAMLLIQFVILPLGSIAGLIYLHAWHHDRKERKWIDAK